MRRFQFIAGPFVLTVVSAAFSQATNPSVSDLQRMLEDKKYQQVIQQASRLLALKGPSAAEYNRFELLKVKAEAQLEHGDTDGALSTLAQLARETNDPHDRDVAQATQLLIHRSSHGKFIPKTLSAGQDKPVPIDILDPITRKAAFEALFNDERQVIQPKLKTALLSSSLPPIFPVIDAVLSLRALDVAASDSSKRTTQLTTELVDHAKKLMALALDGMSKRVDDINTEANTEIVNTQIVVIQGVSTPIQTRSKQGLTDRNTRELKDTIDTCQKIVPVAESLQRLEGSDMTAIIAAANRIRAKASDLLDTHFDTSPRPLGY